MSIPNPRVRAGHALAFAHQAKGVANFGVAAVTTGALFFSQAEDVQIYRGPSFVDPQGITGSEFLKNTHFQAGISPHARIRMYCGNRNTLALLLEHVTHGEATSLQASGDLSVAGDTGSALGSTGTLAGVRPGANTSVGRFLYAKYEGETPSGSARLSLYSDSARTALVARGSHTYAGTVVLAEQNSSGISGTWPINSVTASNLAGIIITVARFRPQRAGQIANYFTLFRDTGVVGEMETLTGCTVHSIRFSSSQGGALIADIMIVAGNYTIGAHDANVVFAMAAADAQYFQHAGATVTYNVTSESFFGLSHGIRHDIAAPLANSDTPVAVFKDGSDLFPIEFSQRLEDNSVAIITDARAGTWRQVVADYVYSTKHLTFTYDQGKSVDADLPGYSGGKWSDKEQHLIARESASSNPADPLVITLDL